LKKKKKPIFQGKLHHISTHFLVDKSVCVCVCVFYLFLFLQYGFASGAYQEGKDIVVLGVFVRDCNFLVISMSKKIIVDYRAWESELCIVPPASFHLD